MQRPPQPRRKRKRGVNFTKEQNAALCAAAISDIDVIDDNRRRLDAKRRKEEAWNRIQMAVAEYSEPGAPAKSVNQLKNKWNRLKIHFITKFQKQVLYYAAGQMSEEVVGSNSQFLQFAPKPGANARTNQGPLGLSCTSDLYDAETVDAPTTEPATEIDLSNQPSTSASTSTDRTVKLEVEDVVTIEDSDEDPQEEDKRHESIRDTDDGDDHRSSRQKQGLAGDQGSNKLPNPVPALKQEPQKEEETTECLEDPKGDRDSTDNGEGGAKNQCEMAEFQNKMADYIDKMARFHDKMADYMDKMADVAELRRSKMRLRIKMLEREEKMAEQRHAMEMERIKNETTLVLAAAGSLRP